MVKYVLVFQSKARENMRGQLDINVKKLKNSSVYTFYSIRQL